MNLLFNIIGNLGMLCFLYAYYALQKKKLDSDSYVYLGLNFSGSVLLIISLLWSWNLAAFLLEVAWGAISLYGIYRVHKAKTSVRTGP